MSEVITTGSYVYLELSSKGLSIDEYNEWVSGVTVEDLDKCTSKK